MKNIYEGEKPYAFISYAHRDTDAVAPVLGLLRDCTCRIWYDEAIQAGSEWPDYIATHLKNSALVIAFVSEAYYNSLNCRRELIYAKRKEKPIIYVVTDKAKIPDDLKPSSTDAMVIKHREFKSSDKLVKSLLAYASSHGCEYDIDELMQYDGQDDTDAERKKKRRLISDRQSEHEQRLRKKEEAEEDLLLKVERERRRRNFRTKYDDAITYTVKLLVVLLNLACPILASVAMHHASLNYVNVPLFALIAALPIMLTHLLSSLIYKLAGLSYSWLDDSSEMGFTGIGCFGVICFIATLIATPFFVHTTESVFLKIIIALAVNCVGGFISLVASTPLSD